jgi:hypothetical protein
MTENGSAKWSKTAALRLVEVNSKLVWRPRFA